MPPISCSRVQNVSKALVEGCRVAGGVTSSGSGSSGRMREALRLESGFGEVARPLPVWPRRLRPLHLRSSWSRSSDSSHEAGTESAALASSRRTRACAPRQGLPRFRHEFVVEVRDDYNLRCEPLGFWEGRYADKPRHLFCPACDRAPLGLPWRYHENQAHLRTAEPRFGAGRGQESGHDRRRGSVGVGGALVHVDPGMATWGEGAFRLGNETFIRAMRSLNARLLPFCAMRRPLGQ